MIKYENDDGRKIRLEINGNLDTIITETAYLPCIVYKSLLEKNACAAEIFRDYFENNSSHDIFASVEEEYMQERQEDLKAFLESFRNKLNKIREEGNKNA